MRECCVTLLSTVAELAGVRQYVQGARVDVPESMASCLCDYELHCGMT